MEFKRKSDLTRHQKKKVPCNPAIILPVALEAKELAVPTNPGPTDIKAVLISTFKSCLNVLRDNEGSTGNKALQTMSQLLILKLLEPRLHDMKMDTYDYDFSQIEDEHLEAHKTKLFTIIQFSKLAEEKEDNIPNIMQYLWDDILSVHPATKSIFLKGKRFDIQYSSTYKKLIDKLNALDLTNNEYDVLGAAYEEVFQDIMTGKTLGQYFTQPSIKRMMVRLINPQIYPDGRVDTCCDPTMGTGGFLITYLQYILRQAKERNTEPDWNFIMNEGLYGKEIDHDTYQLAVANMLISSGHMFEGLERGDSIRVPITRKFDNILANPPYGIKGLRYNDFTSPLKSEYVPIKTDSGVSLFIQAIIYMLKIGGKCAIVLPNGQDLFSKTNKTLVSIREYLLKTCDLQEISYLPSGIFDYTSVRTCVFYFIKKREGPEVLGTKIRVSKTQKETGREYKFSPTHQTTSVKFYDYNPHDDVKTLLVEVPIADIMRNQYSLNYAEYMPDEKKEEKYTNGTVVRTLGEVCTFIPKSKRPASYGEKKGTYPFFTSSQTCNKYCNEFDYKDECLIIGTGGTANIKYGSKFSCSADNFVVYINDGTSVKYLYYYLSINLKILQNGFVGVGLQHISKDYISKIKIPIPTLERQQELVSYLDFIYEQANKTSIAKIAELKQLNAYCLSNQTEFGENVVRTLGEVCDMSIKGNTNSKEISNTGEYPFYKASVSNPSGTHNSYCFDDIEYLLFIKSGGNSSNPLSLSHGIGKVYLVNGKSSGNTEVVKNKKQ